jgi:hypothetical protein
MAGRIVVAALDYDLGRRGRPSDSHAVMNARSVAGSNGRKQAVRREVSAACATRTHTGCGTDYGR